MMNCSKIISVILHYIEGKKKFKRFALACLRNWKLETVLKQINDFILVVYTQHCV